MAEYIERNKICKICSWWTRHVDEKGNCRCGIFNIPAADVAPVAHERWMLVASHSLFDEDGVMCDVEIEEKCSGCSTHVSRYVTELPYAYCHGCGAKMDLEEGADNG